MAIHYVNVSTMHVNSLGGVLPDNMTIAQRAHSDYSHRIIADATVPNSAGNPTIKDYLVLEDAAGFNLVHMDQYTIVTSNQ